MTVPSLMAIIRKARPPRAFTSPPIVDGQGSLTCAVSFDLGNGAPDRALLLPVKCKDQRWGIVEKSGNVVLPTADVDLAQVEFQIGTLDPGQVEDGIVKIRMPWVGQATQALLLLLHPQLESLGDEILLRMHLDFVLWQLAADQAPPLRIEGLADTGDTTPPAMTSRETMATKRYLLKATTSELERGVITLRQAPAAPPAPAGTDHRAPSRGDTAEPRARSFALASCQYPAGMVDGGTKRQLAASDDSAVGPAERSLWRLGAELEANPDIAFTVLAGDQVYVDATAGLFDPATLLDRFSFAYQSMLRNKGLQRVMRVANHALLPVLDDHELDDNWEPNSPAPEASLQSGYSRIGKINYRRYQVSMWPGPPRQKSDPLWVQTPVGGWSFFFADTRTARDGRGIANWRTASILDSTQEAKLLAWIGAVPPTPEEGEGATPPPTPTPTPRFVVSPSILLPRPLALQAHQTACLEVDSWCGYPRSLHRVLERLFLANARGVVFLSGDEHLSCAASVKITLSGHERELVTHSVHSSALYAPYPFANATEAEFAGDEAFHFADPQWPSALFGPPRHYTCIVRTKFSTRGDGFALLEPKMQGTAWNLGVRFFGASGPSQDLTLAL